MSQFDELYAQVPISQLASRFGVDESEMAEAVRTALPALVGGLEANASDPAGADSLMRALSQHTESPSDLDQVDTTDGEKIVGHIYGDNTDQVVQQLGGLGGMTGSLVQKLLPILAPIVLSWLAGKMGGAGGLGSILGDMFGGRDQAAPAPERPATDVDSGPLFPGGAGAQSGPVQSPTDTGATSTGPSAGSNPLQDILGDVLGGAKSGGGGNILGDLLGGLLGGGRR
jgi:hypothetical protein